MFVAQSHRNFRLLWIGLLVSFSGTFMQSAAVLWPENRGKAAGSRFAGSRVRHESLLSSNRARGSVFAWGWGPTRAGGGGAPPATKEC